MNRTERSQLIDALIEGDISEADFLRLEAEFSVDPAARQEYYDRLSLSVALETEAGATSDTGSKIVAMPAPALFRIPAWVAIAAAMIALAAVANVVLQKASPRDLATAPAGSFEGERICGARRSG